MSAAWWAGRARWQWPVVAVLAAYALVSVAVGASHALSPGQSQDFAPVYMAARLWLAGQDPYRAYSPEEWQRATGAREAPVASIDRAYSTPYPPVALVGVAGISGGEWRTARAAWLLINLALAAYVPWLLRRLWFGHFPLVATAALFALWFGGIGLRVGLANGQHAIFWLATMLSALWLMSTGRAGWAGIPLSLSLHKYPLTAVFLPYFLARRAWGLLAVAALASLAWLIVFVGGLQVSVMEVAASFAREVAWWYGQSGGGGLPGGITDVFPIVARLTGDDAQTVAMVLLVGAGTTLACWPIRASDPGPRPVDAACLVLLMLWGTYHRVYDTIVIIVPLVVLAVEWRRSPPGWFRRMVAGLTCALAAAWYADASSLYRRFDPVPLDRLPQTDIFALLDVAYRLVIFAAFLVLIVLRFRTRDPAGGEVVA